MGASPRAFQTARTAFLLRTCMQRAKPRGFQTTRTSTRVQWWTTTDRLEEWLNPHLPPLTVSTPLATERLWRHRFSTLMALSRYRDAFLRHCPPERPVVYQDPLISEVLTFYCLLVPHRAPTHAGCLPSNGPVPSDAVCFPRDLWPPTRAWSLLLTPRLDAQTTFAKLFADIGGRPLPS